MRLFAGTEFDIPPTCERCGKLEENCACPPSVAEPVAPEKQTLRIQVEKRKKGKSVTVIRGLAESNDHAQLLTQLKNFCGAGGTIKEATIEIQGDHQERVRIKLNELKYKVRPA